MKKINLLSFVIIGVFCIALTSAAMTRNVPISSDGNFQVTYQVDNSGTWGASIVDVVSGGCTFPGGTNELRTVMLSSDGNTKTISVTAPNSGTCTFNGDYKFGTESEVDFPSASVSVSGGNGDDGNSDSEIPYLWIAVAGVLFLLVILKKK